MLQLMLHLTPMQLPVIQLDFLPQLCSMGPLQGLAWRQLMWKASRHLG